MISDPSTHRRGATSHARARGGEWIDAVRDGATVVTVNRRLARDLVDRFERERLAAGDRVWATPDILPLDAWLLARHDDALAAGFVEEPRLPDCLLREYWRAAIDADDALWLLDPDRMAEEALVAHALAARWYIDTRTDAGATPDADAFARWRRRVAGRLRRERVTDTETAIDRVVALIEAEPLALSLPDELRYAGFLDLEPRQQRLFSALESAGTTVAALEPVRDARLSRRACVDDERLLREVVTEVRDAHTQTPAAALAVVIPDLATRRQAVSRVFDQVFFPGCSPETIAGIERPYEFSYGTPLIEHAVVRSAIQLLALLDGAIDAAAWSALLLSPYLVGASDETDDRQRVERWLRDRRVAALDASGMARLLASDSRLARALRHLETRRQYRTASRRTTQAGERTRRRRTATPTMAERLSEILETFGWPGTKIDSTEHQAVEAFRSCLDDLERVEPLADASPRESLRRLDRFVRERVFQPETPLRPIRVLGRLESHGIDVDRLWLTGLDTEHWPPEPSPSPFITLDAQRRAGVPMASSSRLLERARRELDLWRRSADQVCVRHARVRDDRRLTLASLIQAVPETDSPAPPTPPQPVCEPAGDTTLEIVTDTSGPALGDAETVLGGAKLFEFQAACPFKAFATYRLGARALEEPGPGLDPRTLGDLLHRALELFWESVETHAGLLALDARGEFDAVLARTLEQVFEEVSLDSAERARERVRLTRLLSHWFERYERPRQPFTVVHRERACDLEIGGIPLSLKVDRIDRLESGAEVVLDYKTGRHNRTDSWDADRIDAPQLPLYALTDDAIEGIAFAQIAMHDWCFRGLAATSDSLPSVKVHPEHDWASLRRHWASTFASTAAEIRAGVASVSPTGQACRYCTLSPICRIDEHRSTPADEADSRDGDRAP